MSAAPATPGGRRRGRRPAGQQTRDALVTAARTEFTERGYDQARVRSIAAAAGVDPAMVNHWFGGKDGLFLEAMDIPIDPARLLEQILDGDREHTGERIVRTFLSVWDPMGGGPLVALLRSVSNHEAAARMMREFLAERLFGQITAAIQADRPGLRAGLCASQMVGLGMARYVIRFEPLASTEVDTLAGAIGPTLQRYLTGDLG